LELGETYEFKVLLKARRPGDWHVHTMMNVKGGGPIIGLGKWVIVTGIMGSFVNSVIMLLGDIINLETYNLSNTYFWHVFWYALGLAWLGYWVCKPIFVLCYIVVEAGKADSLIIATDKKVAMGFVIGIIVVVVFGMSSINVVYFVIILL